MNEVINLKHKQNNILVPQILHQKSDCYFHLLENFFAISTANQQANCTLKYISRKAIL